MSLSWPSNVQDRLRDSLLKRQNQNQLRRLKRFDWRNSIDFCSNDYLGLARLGKSAAISEGEQQMLRGATGSRLLTGNSILAEELEQELALFLEAESSVLFNSGYDANLGLLTAIFKEGDVILSDELVHASLRDGARLSGAQRFNFRHNDLTHLEKKLRHLAITEGPKKTQRLLGVVVESVYSMDGDMAPLKELAQLCQRYEVLLIVDEAHATGIYGAKGAGLVAELQLQQQVFARIHTFGKALGGHGACVVGEQLLRDYLLNFARSLIYSTSLPPHSLLLLRESLHYLQQNGVELRRKLKENIAYFTQIMKSFGLCQSQRIETPIIPLFFPPHIDLNFLSQQLLMENILVFPIFSPTVRRGSERLRLCMHAFNSKEEIELFVSILGKNLCL